MRSILPNSDATILQPIETQHGVFQVKLIPLIEDHGLFLNDFLIAIHNNGYSCHNLAKRIIEVWKGDRQKAYALEQFDYILACGGLGCPRGSLERIVEGCNDEE